MYVLVGCKYARILCFDMCWYMCMCTVYICVQVLALKILGPWDGEAKLAKHYFSKLSNPYKWIVHVRFAILIVTVSLLNMYTRLSSGLGCGMRNRLILDGDRV